MAETMPGGVGVGGSGEHSQASRILVRAVLGSPGLKLGFVSITVISLSSALLALLSLIKPS